MYRTKAVSFKAFWFIAAILVPLGFCHGGGSVDIEQPTATKIVEGSGDSRKVYLILKKDEMVTIKLDDAGVEDLSVTFENGKIGATVPGTGNGEGPFNVVYETLALGKENKITYSCKRSGTCITTNATAGRVLVPQFITPGGIPPPRRWRRGQIPPAYLTGRTNLRFPMPQRAF